MRELFVYYRVALADRDGCRAAVLALHARLARETPGLVARLLARPEAQDGHATWMETYAIDGTGIDARLQARIEQEATALAPWLAGPRHVEVFIRLT